MKKTKGKTVEILVIIALLCAACAMFAIGFKVSYDRNKLLNVVRKGTCYAYKNEDMTYGHVFNHGFETPSWEYKEYGENSFIIFDGYQYNTTTDAKDEVTIMFLVSNGEYMISNVMVNGFSVDTSISYPIINSKFEKYAADKGIDCTEAWPDDDSEF